MEEIAYSFLTDLELRGDINSQQNEQLAVSANDKHSENVHDRKVTNGITDISILINGSCGITYNIISGVLNTATM